MRRVLVTGATGCIGRALTGKLLARDLEVRVLVRDPNAFHRIFPQAAAKVTVICGELSDSIALNRAVHGVDTIFHLAAKVHVVPPCPAQSNAFRVNVEDTRRLLLACRNDSLRTFVFFSTIAVFGAKSCPLSEEVKCTPDTPYGVSKYETEQVIQHYFAGSEVRPTVLRLAMVFGEGDRGNFLRMVRAIGRRRFFLPGRGDAQKSIAYSGNVADVAIQAATTERARGEVFVIADAVWTVRELAQCIARALGMPSPTLQIPAWALHIAGKSLQRLRATFGVNVPFTDMDARALLRGTVCDTSKVRRILGFEPGVSVEEGIARTIKWYRSTSM